MLAGHVMTGAWVSKTVTAIWQDETLPLLSTAVKVKRFDPTWNKAGEEYCAETFATWQLSVATALGNETDAVQVFGSSFTVMLDGQAARKKQGRELK